MPALARHLGVTPAFLYERQRALVRAGLLESREGRGPGSGVLADAYGIALLLIAVMATDTLSRTEERAKEMMALTAAHDKKQKLVSLLDMIAGIFLDEKRPSRVHNLTISRTAALAILRVYDDDGKMKAIRFIGDDYEGDRPLALYAQIEARTLSQIADDVMDIVAETMLGEEEA